jgi:hypothetical protein
MRTPRWFFGIILCITALAGGCATPAVWGIKTCHPASNPSLSLAFDSKSNDILVKYEEQRASSKSVQTRFYWLLANADNPPKNHRPHFVNEVNSPDLISVPVITCGMTNSVPETGYGAKMLADERSFDLYRNGVSLGRFFLPDYSSPAQPATISRVMLTPPAVIADTLIVTGVAAVYLAPYALEAYAGP